MDRARPLLEQVGVATAGLAKQVVVVSRNIAQHLVESQRGRQRREIVSMAIVAAIVAVASMNVAANISAPAAAEGAAARDENKKIAVASHTVEINEIEKQ